MTCTECKGTKKVCPVEYSGCCAAGNTDPPCSECIEKHGIPCRGCSTEEGDEACKTG